VERAIERNLGIDEAHSSFAERVLALADRGIAAFNQRFRVGGVTAPLFGLGRRNGHQHHRARQKEFISHRFVSALPR
jgi:hypothetical protein